jgi:histidinol-phosphate aminotransferase
MSAPKPRPEPLTIAPYVGGEHSAEGYANPIRLASNEGAFGPSAKARAAYEALAKDIHRYPDGGAHALRRALAEHFSIDAERIMCGAGSDEIITLLARGFAGPGDEVVYSRHGFLMYPIAAQAAGATPVVAAEKHLRTDIEAVLAAITEKTRIVYIANPNNPTGSYITRKELETLHARLRPDILLVIDAAYAEYAESADYDCGLALAHAAENVVMTRTFSKIYALGGLRLGWGYGSAAIADIYNRLRGPFNLSSAAMAAGIAALQDTPFLETSRTHNTVWRNWLAQELGGMGLIVHPSIANFVLVEFPAGRAEAARLFLKSRGILVRQMGRYGLPDCLRITIGLEQEMRAVATQLRAFLESAA